MLADVPARPAGTRARGLLHRGHRRVHLRSGAERAGRPIRPTAPSTSTRRSRRSASADRWAFVNYDGTHHGASHEQVRQWCADADLFINLSGGSWFWRDEYAAIPRKVFVDSDPVFTQLALAKGDEWYVNFFRGFDRHFTFGANIGTPASDGADQRLHLAPHVAAGRAGSVANHRPAGRSVHDGHDLEDRELHRRRRQQGSGVRQVHRPPAAAPMPASSWP